MKQIRIFPIVEITWTWNNKKEFKYQFHDSSLPSSFPYSITKTWNKDRRFELSKREAIFDLGFYCGYNRFASDVKIKYDDKIIHKGPLLKEEKEEPNETLCWIITIVIIIALCCFLPKK